MQDLPTIFVLEISEGPDLAFRADSAKQAGAIALAPWFRHAIGNVLTGTRQASVRAATAVEARIYGNLCAEFDEPARRFLVANLSGFREQSAGKAAAALS